MEGLFFYFWNFLLFSRRDFHSGCWNTWLRALPLEFLCLKVLLWTESERQPHSFLHTFYGVDAYVWIQVSFITVHGIFLLRICFLVITKRMAFLLFKLLNYYNFKSFIAAFLLLLGMCCVFLFVFCFCIFHFCCWLQWDYLKFVVLSICDAVVCLILLPVWYVGKLPLLIHSSFLIFFLFFKVYFQE